MHCPRHDVAWPAALGILSVFEEWVPEGKHQEAMKAVYRRVIAALEAYDISARSRLHDSEPSEN